MTALADPFDARLADAAVGLLRPFNEIGLLAAADVHVALRLCSLADEEREAVALAVALAVRAPRLGHVFVDLSTVRDTASVESEEPVDLSALPWPEPRHWLEALAASPLVAVGEGGDADGGPLRLLGSRLYLDRYWREERQVAGDLLALAAGASDVSEEQLATGLDRLFPGDGDQRPSRPRTSECRLTKASAPHARAASRRAA